MGRAGDGRDIGEIAVGKRADIVVLDAAHPDMANGTATALDTYVFVAGERLVQGRDGRRRWSWRMARTSITTGSRQGIAKTMERLASSATALWPLLGRRDPCHLPPLPLFPPPG